MTVLRAGRRALLAYPAMLLAWAVVRLYGLFALHGAFPYNRSYPSDGDLHVYWQWAWFIWHGGVPYHSIPVIPLLYPPGVLPFLVLPTPTFGAYEAEFLALALATDVLVLLALLGTGRRLGAWAWVVAPLLLGPVFWARFDIFVAGLLVAGVVAMEHRRYGWAAACLSWAALLKVWPLVLLLLLLRQVPRERRRVYATVGFAILVVAVVPFLAIGGSQGLWFVMRLQSSRGVEVESLYALPLYAVHAAGHVVPIVLAASYQFAGSADSVVAGVATGLTVLAVIALGWLSLQRRANWSPVGLLLATVALLLLTDKVLSPQYLVWVVVAVALAVDGVRDRRVLLWTLAGLLLTTQAQFPFGFALLRRETTGALVLSALHAASLLAFAAVALRTSLQHDLGWSASAVVADGLAEDLHPEPERVPLGVLRKP